MSKAAIYCRVGRNEQCELQALSAQGSSCKQYAGINLTEYEKYKKVVEESKRESRI